MSKTTSKPRVIDAQERLRTVRYPLRLTDDVYENDPLQSHRIQTRYDILQDHYAEYVGKLKRGDEVEIPLQFNLERHKESSQQWARERGIQWGWDIPLLNLKLLSNFDYACDNDNKYLMQECIHRFPIMNYVLKEGPFKVRPQAVFGEEDYHVIIQGDGNNLIYFLPERDRLNRGLYVECKL